MRESGDPRVGSIVFYGMVGVLLTILIILGLQALYHRATSAEAVEKVYAQEWQELGRLRAQQEAELNSYRWISEKQGIAGIPIDLALELVTSELRAEQAERLDQAKETTP